MKSRLITLHSLFLIAMVGLIAMSFAGMHPVFVSLLAALALFTIITILKNWLAFITIMVSKSNKALNVQTERRSRWSFFNIEQLERNQDLDVAAS